LLDGVNPVSVSVVETTPGEFPVSNLERSSVPVDVVITTPTEGQYPANSLENLGGPVVVTVTTVVDAADAEPVWPTAIGGLVEDGQILWLGVKLNGTPDVWEPSTTYKVGDFVSPSSPVEDVETEELMMFQCVGFVGRSGTTEPVWPITEGDTVLDNNIEWAARDPQKDPQKLNWNEYFDIIQTVNLEGP
jgi:hypothetical protein